MKKYIPKIIGITLVLLVTLYFVFQIYYVVSPNYRTEVAILFEVTDEIVAEGTVVRDEKVAHSDAGVKYFIVSDGDKVAAGSVVAERYERSETAEKGIAQKLLVQEYNVLSSIQSG
ncbi:MAG: HlyD family efflux transporter periplasmic adaptor subunit, partial [Oscillospiraceae bacterium]|nr:HlyD family efflux transporter periplasmic adaptor subunit [Oscillospiraceae bacterium]